MKSHFDIIFRLCTKRKIIKLNYLNVIRDQGLKTRRFLYINPTFEMQKFLGPENGLFLRKLHVMRMPKSQNVSKFVLLVGLSCIVILRQLLISRRLLPYVLLDLNYFKMY